MAAAYANVQKHYPGAKLLGEKHASLVALAMCCGRIYGKRAAVIVGIKPRPKEPDAPPEPGPVAVNVPHLNGGAEMTGDSNASWFPNG